MDLTSTIVLTILGCSTVLGLVLGLYSIHTSNGKSGN